MNSSYLVIKRRVIIWSFNLLFVLRGFKFCWCFKNGFVIVNITLIMVLIVVMILKSMFVLIVKAKVSRIE